MTEHEWTELYSLTIPFTTTRLRDLGTTPLVTNEQCIYFGFFPDNYLLYIFLCFSYVIKSNLTSVLCKALRSIPGVRHSYLPLLRTLSPPPPPPSSSSAVPASHSLLNTDYSIHTCTVRQPLVIHFTVNEWRELIALNRQGTQQQSPEWPAVTPPASKYKVQVEFMYPVFTCMPGGVTIGDSGLFQCPLSVGRCQVLLFVDSTQAL